MTANLKALADRMGVTASDLADAEPWGAATCANYVRYHSKRVTGAHWPDAQVASAVRMLGRQDLDHEAVVTMARDRICALVAEKAALADFIERVRPVLEAEQKRRDSLQSVTFVKRAPLPSDTECGDLASEAEELMGKVRGGDLGHPGGADAPPSRDGATHCPHKHSQDEGA